MTRFCLRRSLRGTRPGQRTAFLFARHLSALERVWVLAMLFSNPFQTILPYITCMCICIPPLFHRLSGHLVGIIHHVEQSRRSFDHDLTSSCVQRLCAVVMRSGLAATTARHRNAVLVPSACLVNHGLPRRGSFVHDPTTSLMYSRPTKKALHLCY